MGKQYTLRLLMEAGTKPLYQHKTREKALQLLLKSFFYSISLKYLYTVGLLSPHTLASSETLS